MVAAVPKSDSASAKAISPAARMAGSRSGALILSQARHRYREIDEREAFQAQDEDDADWRKEPVDEAIREMQVLVGNASTNQCERPGLAYQKGGREEDNPDWNVQEPGQRHICPPRENRQKRAEYAAQ